jgi:2-C-methyl-D-erythritol 2,4-cyclodiphosphate synthase
MRILEGCNDLLHKKGYHVVNVDSLVMIERPKMAPHIQQMRENIANALHVDVDFVNVKATRGEKMGFVGREEGVLAQAVVLVESD